MWATWVRTVPRPTTRRSAISLLERPLARKLRTGSSKPLAKSACRKRLVRSGLYEPGFVGEDDCLSAVSQTEFAQDAGDMRLDGGLGYEQGL